MAESLPRLCALHDLADPGTREFSIGEGEWPLRGFIVRYQGEVRAYRNSCPHAGWPLNLKPNTFFAPGCELLICTTHGALFKPLSGQCVAGPCIGRGLQALSVEVIDGCIYLSSHPDAFCV